MRINARIYDEGTVNVSAEDIVYALYELGAPENISEANRLITTCHSLIRGMDVTLLPRESRKIIAKALREQAERYEVTP